MNVNCFEIEVVEPVETTTMQTVILSETKNLSKTFRFAQHDATLSF